MQLCERFSQLRSTVKASTTKISTAALALCLSGSTLALEANNANEALKTLHKVQIQTYAALNAYYNFSTAQGDKSILMDIREATDNANTLVNTLKNNIGNEYGTENSAIEKDWDSYQKLINTNVNDVLKQGYPDLRLVSDLSKLNTDFNNKLSSLYQTINDDAQKDKNSIIENTRHAAVLMSTMTTRYSARATSNVSQTFQGDTSEKPLDVLAQEFDQLIKKLSQQTESNKEISEQMESISTKWSFIKDSYVNYSEKNVNYVVDLYSRRIIASLENIDEALLK